jgi:hypothetical protein
MKDVDVNENESNDKRDDSIETAAGGAPRDEADAVGTGPVSAKSPDPTGPKDKDC